MADDQEKSEAQQKVDEAGFALDSIEAKHVAGGGAADISQEVEHLRGFLGEAGQAIDKQAQDQAKADADKAAAAEARAAKKAES